MHPAVATANSLMWLSAVVLVGICHCFWPCNKSWRSYFTTSLITSCRLFLVAYKLRRRMFSRWRWFCLITDCCKLLFKRCDLLSNDEWNEDEYYFKNVKWSCYLCGWMWGITESPFFINATNAGALCFRFFIINLSVGQCIKFLWNRARDRIIPKGICYLFLITIYLIMDSFITNGGSFGSVPQIYIQILMYDTPFHPITITNTLTPTNLLLLLLSHPIIIIPIIITIGTTPTKWQ